MGMGPEALEQAGEQRRARHPIRVIVAADGHRLPLLSGQGQAIDGPFQIRKMAVGVGGFRGIQ